MCARFFLCCHWKKPLTLHTVVILLILVVHITVNKSNVYDLIHFQNIHGRSHTYRMDRSQLSKLLNLNVVLFFFGTYLLWLNCSESFAFGWFENPHDIDKYPDRDAWYSVNGIDKNISINSYIFWLWKFHFENLNGMHLIFIYLWSSVKICLRHHLNGFIVKNVCRDSFRRRENTGVSTFEWQHDCSENAQPSPSTTIAIFQSFH